MTQCQGAGGIGTRYTYAQLEGIWINNGGNKAMAPLMAAVAEVESGGCSTAYNASGATGLWQIEWPLHEGIVPGATSRQALFNPNTNAKAAIRLSGNKNSVAPGSPVYDNWLQYEPPGAYKQFLKNSTTPDTSVPGGSSTGGGTTATLTAASSPGCLLGIPSVDLKVTSIGGGCIVSKSEGRAVIGAMVMASGAVILGLGALVLVAIGLKHSGAGRVAGGALEAGGAAAAVLGAPEVGVPLAAGGAAVRRGSARQAATSAAVRSGRRQVSANRAAARQAARPAPAPKAPAGPQGRHAKSGPNRPAQGRHAARPQVQPA